MCCALWCSCVAFSIALGIAFSMGFKPTEHLLIVCAPEPLVLGEHKTENRKKRARELGQLVSARLCVAAVVVADANAVDAANLLVVFVCCFCNVICFHAVFACLFVCVCAPLRSLVCCVLVYVCLFTCILYLFVYLRMCLFAYFLSC